MTACEALPALIVRLARDELHIFKRLGKYFAVHKPTGEFFALDDSGFAVLRRLQEQAPEEAIPALKELFGQDASQVLDDLANIAASLENERKNVRAEAPPEQMTDLTLNVVNHCNLSCVYCWNEGGTYGGQKAKGSMSADIALRAVDLLLQSSDGADSLVVDFYGGEPLLNMQTMRRTLEYCRRLGEEKGIRFSFLLATNGLLLTPEVASWLHEARVNVALSLDGDKSVQDAQRPLPDGSGSFEIIWNNLRSIPEEIRADYEARATLTPSGPGAMRTYHMLRDLGFRRIEVFESEAACFGLPLEHADRFYIREGDRKRLMEEYETLVTHLIGLVSSGEVEYRDLFFTRVFKQMARLVRNGDFEGPCAAGLGQMAVDTEGYVYPCTAFIGQPQWRMGHVDSGLDASVQERIKTCDILSSESCQTCWARNLCLGSGSCFNLNHFNHKDISKPVDEHCELYRFKVELLIAGLATLQEMNPERFDKLFAPGHFEDRTAWSPAYGD